MGKVGMNDNDRRLRYRQRYVSFGGSSEWLAASPFVTTGLARTESVDPGVIKLLNRSDLFFCGPFELYYYVTVSE